MMGKEEKKLMNSIAACFEILAYDKARDLQHLIRECLIKGKGKTISVKEIGEGIGVSLNTLIYLASRMPEIYVDPNDKGRWGIDEKLARKTEILRD